MILNPHGGAMVAGSLYKPDGQSDLLFTQVNAGKSMTSALSQAVRQEISYKILS